MKVELECAKETREFVEVLEKLIVETKKAVADGFQPGADIPQVLFPHISDLAKALEGIDKIPSEASADMELFLNALAPLPGKLVSVFKKEAKPDLTARQKNAQNEAVA